MSTLVPASKLTPYEIGLWKWAGGGFNEEKVGEDSVVLILDYHPEID